MGGPDAWGLVARRGNRLPRVLRLGVVLHELAKALREGIVVPLRCLEVLSARGKSRTKIDLHLDERPPAQASDQDRVLRPGPLAVVQASDWKSEPNRIGPGPQGA
jgi:hypothetical protein